MNELAYGTIFEKGIPNPYVEFFCGKSYLAMLTQLNGVGVANVTFEPACRNNWHIHHGEKGGGQILLVIGGSGWYQEWGKDAQKLQAGDVVTIPVGVKHWHGAAKDSWFAHIAIEVPGENTSNEWLKFCPMLLFMPDGRRRGLRLEWQRKSMTRRLDHEERLGVSAWYHIDVFFDCVRNKVLSARRNRNYWKRWLNHDRGSNG